MVPCWHAGCCTWACVGAQAAGLQCAAECKLTWCIESPQLQRATVTEDSAPHTGHWAPGHSRSGASRSCYNLLLISTTFYYLLLLATSLLLNVLKHVLIWKPSWWRCFKTWPQSKDKKECILALPFNDRRLWVCLGDCVRQGSAMVWQCGLLSWSHSSLPAPSDLLQLTACTT